MISFSQILTPGQYPATQTNDAASAGRVGEFISSNVAAPGSAITTATNTDITSISLTPGDWDVWGSVAFAPDATTSITNWRGWISTTSATIPSAPGEGAYENRTFPANIPAATEIFGVGQIRISVAVTTTVYLSVRTAFTISTMNAYGYIAARRAR
jgi:hypothetical protein